MSLNTQKPKRRRGRPLKEDSVAIAADKAIFDYKSGVVALVPDALVTLQSLLVTGSEKVKEGVAKFIIAEAKEVHENYLQQEDDLDDAKPTSADAESETTEEDDVIPISLNIR